MRLLPYGERAVLVEVDDPGSVLALSAAIGRTAGVLEAVPAARTLLVRFDPQVTTAAAIGHALESGVLEPLAEVPLDPVVLTVRYDGPDLLAVAAEVGISVQELVGRHTAAAYQVAFCGFAPGFAYLTGLDPMLYVGRLAEPRTTVPPGSVGVAGEFTGVYPRCSPGGWRLLGATDALLWDTARVPPALLAPGTPVRFRPA
ncbi:MAG: allophanate hydrolase subunit 1 [Jatrophihabitantaceae bacterium]